jgi:putative inorganic carbon (HCO3(-)) transporter
MPVLPNIRKHIPVIVIVLCYILADMVLTYKEIYVLNALPVLVLIVYLALARIDWLYFILIALTPLSIQLIEFVPSSSIDFAIPTEPMLFGIMLLLIYRSVQLGILDRSILNHPVTYAIFFNLFWIFITAITSTMPLVSFKFLLARLWFITVFYLLAILIFRNTDNIRVFILCYTLPMMIVIAYSITRHLSYGLFNKDAAHFVMNPFYRDHTSYGAILAMLFFAMGGLVLSKKRDFLYQLIVWGTWIVITLALVLSYTRAAWISVLVSVGVLVLVMLRIKLRYILLAGLISFGYLTGQRVVIIHKMQKNRQVSSATLSEHVKSISNITTDESNLERINRWNSAFRILGSLSFILIGILTLITGFRVYNHAFIDKRLRQIVLALLLGYITYLIHGMLNNFLDTDKASALFWGFTAVFVSLDLSLKKLDPQN